MVERGLPIVPSIPGVYTPSPWQVKFHASRPDELLGAGSAGPGKTYTLIHDPIDIVLVEAERRRLGHISRSSATLLFLRRQLNMLGEAVSRAQRSFHQIDPGVKSKDESGKTTFTFSSGLKFVFGGCKDIGDWQQYQGAEYIWIGFDELTQFEEVQYFEIGARLRTGDPVLSKLMRIRAASNPAGNWVRKRFVEPCPEGSKLIREKVTSPQTGESTYKTRLYLRATLYDNPNAEFVKQYEANLLQKPPHIRNAYLYGDWYTVVGAYFAEEFDRARHVIKPFRIPQGWKRFRSMDWGYKTYGAVHWWALTHDGEMICTDEYTFRKKTAAEVAKRIKQIEEANGLWDKVRNRSKLTGPADTQLWEERGDTAPSKALEMSKAGVNWVKANKKSRQNNAERVLGRLKDVEGEYPGICFFDACRQIIRTLPGLMPDDSDPNEPAKCDDDHWYDSVSYACAYAAAPSKAKDSDFIEDEEDRKARKRRDSDSIGYGKALPWT